MEQSTSSFDDFDFDEDEREVVAILLVLPELIAKLEHSRDWGFKRKRTAVVLSTSSSSRFRSPSLHSSRPPRPSVVAVDEDSMPMDEPEEPIVKVVQATSPVTPLSLSLSESDENPECSKRSCSRRAFGPETEESSVNLALGISRDTAKSPTVESAPVIRHCRSSIIDQTAHRQSPPLFHTPDLNVSPPPPEHYFQAAPFFPYLAKINRAMAAQRARQRRIGICRANKLRPRVR